MSSLKVISLFSGAGGLDYGFEAAGFETMVAVEMDTEAAATLKANRSFPVLQRDIHTVPGTELLAAASLDVGEADLVLGGPPCQPFSKAGFWASGDTKRLNDPRASTLDEYMRVVDETLPKVFVLENVHGISYTGKEEGLRLLERLVAEINAKRGTDYQLSWRVLNAADYGVPQLRSRFFLVGHREGGKFTFPAPTHTDLTTGAANGLFPPPDLSPYVTAWDAIGNLEVRPHEALNVGGRWGDLLPSIPEGENYLWHTDRKGGIPLFGWRTRYWSFLLKLAKNRPSWTIQAQPGPAIGPFHWESRLLSSSELARIQTFPENIRIIGTRRAVQRQLGNAVPSLLGEVLGREIVRQFFGMMPSETPSLAVSLQRPIPSPEAVAAVLDKYLHLEGDYAPHPGTGKGPASRLSQQGELVPVEK